METKVKTSSLKTKMMLMMISLIIMDLLTNSRDMEILLKLDPGMTGTMILEHMSTRRRGTMQLHIGHQRTSHHSGMRITLWQDHTLQSQEMNLKL